MSSPEVKKEVLVDNGDTIMYAECGPFGARAVIDECGTVVSYSLLKDNAVVLDLDADEYNELLGVSAAVVREKFLIWRESVRREIGEVK